LQPSVTAIEGLYKRATILVQQIYEITGISDIMRGASQAAETATAQSIKANFGSMRLQKRQRRVQKFTRDIVRIKTEIIAEHFTREMLEEMTGIRMPLKLEQQAAQSQLMALQQQAQMAQAAAQAPPQLPPPGPQGAPPNGMAPNGMANGMGHNGGPPMPQQPPMPPPQPPDPAMIQELQEIIKLPNWEDISAILRSDARRSYKVDIETDQTAAVDETEEKNTRIEFLTSMNQLMQQAIPLAMQMPLMRPLVKETVQFAVRAFKAGRPLEQAFEDAFVQLEKLPPPPPQGMGDPSKQADAEHAKAKTQIALQQAQTDAQSAQVENAIKMQSHQADQAMMQLDMQGKQQELVSKAQDQQLDRAIKARSAQRDHDAAAMDAAMAHANADLAGIMHQVQVEQAAQDMAQSGQSHALDLAERQQRMRHAEVRANRPPTVQQRGATNAV
jgi:hypothetical protein